MRMRNLQWIAPKETAKAQSFASCQSLKRKRLRNRKQVHSLDLGIPKVGHMKRILQGIKELERNPPSLLWGVVAPVLFPGREVLGTQYRVLGSHCCSSDFLVDNAPLKHLSGLKFCCGWKFGFEVLENHICAKNKQENNPTHSMKPFSYCAKLTC